MDEHYLQLVKQLGAAQFDQRESATFELLSAGEAALPALRKVSAEVPFEVRERSRLIARKIAARIFAQQSRQFLLDTDPSNSYQLPGWKYFRPIVGSTRTSKLLFLEMLEDDRELVNHIVAAMEAEQGSSAKRELVSRLADELTLRAEELNPRLYSLSAPGIGEMVTVLFAATATEMQPPIEVNRMLLNASQLSFQGYLRQPGYKDCLLRLLAVWLPRTHDSMAPEAIRLAMSLDLPVLTQQARRHLGQNFDVVTRAMAFQYMARYGEASDVPALLEYSDDDTVVEEYSDLDSDIAVAAAAPPGIPFRQLEPPSNQRSGLVRILDLAVASAMMILEEDPRTVFPRVSQASVGQEFGSGLRLHELAVIPEEAEKQAAAGRAWARSVLDSIPRS